MRVTERTGRHLSHWVLLTLALEKIVQHVTVTIGFATDWHHIRDTVEVDYRVLMVSGALIGLLFVVSIFGLLNDRPWSVGLLTALATVDIIGEFIAQGTLGITLNVSFLVAWAILITCLWHNKTTTSPTTE